MANKQIEYKDKFMENLNNIFTNKISPTSLAILLDLQVIRILAETD